MAVTKAPLKSPLALLGQRYESVFRLLLQTSLFAYGSYLLLFLALGIPILPFVNIALVAATACALWLLRHGRMLWALGLMSVAVLAHALIATWLLGWHVNFHLFVFLILIFQMLCPYLSTRWKLLLFVLLTLAYGGGEYFFQRPALAHLDTAMLVIQSLNTVVFSAILGFLAHTYAMAVRESTLELHAANADLLRLATTDALTSLLNRRSLRELLQGEIERCNRSGRAFSVVLGDIDGFKAINDAHGHQAGDLILTAASQRLREAVRTQDRVGRWGGEEFLVFLPETGLREAETVTRRIQQALSATPIACGTQPVTVRMTFGVAQFNPGQALDDLLVRADRALYAGKAAGKNRIVLAD